MYTNLEYGYLISSNAKKIVVSFDEERKFQYTYLRRKEVYNEVIGYLSSLINPTPVLEIVLNEGESKRLSKADIVNSAENFKERMIRSSFKNNEFVKNIITEFNAVIVDMNIKVEE